MESGVRALLRRASEKMDLPSAVIAGLPKVELNGFTELLIDHHTGIQTYTQTQIVVGVCIGAIQIDGGNLTIRQMNSEQIVVRGVIEQIVLRSEVSL